MIRKLPLCLIVALSAGLWLSASAYGQTRVALVIGNSAYRYVPPLANTRNDAADMVAAFERLGFQVHRVNDGGYDDMRSALLAFGKNARNSEMAVVFFAGHGIEVGGENWLIPI